MMLLHSWLLLLAFCSASSLSKTSHHRLQLTAVVSGDDGIAKFECWEMATPFSTYPTVGEAIPTLANVTEVSYVVLPPRSAEGLHNPPHPMLFVLLAGLAHVTLPQGDDELWIMEGVNNLIVAVDVKGDGHYTEYPSDKPSIALQLPVREGEVPEHSVIKKGVCDPGAVSMNRSFSFLDQAN